MVMHPSRTAALAAAFWLALSLANPATSHARPAPGAKAGDVLDRARERLAHNDAPGAAALLEAALPGTAANDRSALVGLLRQAYETAARQAEAAGKAEEAETYRDNLAILDRGVHHAAGSTASNSTTTGPTRDPAPGSSPPAPVKRLPSRSLDVPSVAQAAGDPPSAPGPPAQKSVTSPIEPLPQSKAVPDEAAGNAPSARPLADSGVVKASAGEAKPVTPVAAPPAASPAPTAQPPVAAGLAAIQVSVASADAAFVARHYDAAGAIYAALDARKALPADRRDHWAYCRAVEVVRRMNARPSTAGEWAAIDAEIEQIRRLSPNNWFAEYLRNRAMERNPGARTVRSNKVVVRGSSPEEPPGVTTPAAAVQPPQPLQPAAPAGLPPAAAAPVRWSPQPVFTANFQVVHVEGQRALAEQVGKAAEDARAALVKRWGETTPGQTWLPRCEILLFPTAADFSRGTGQPPESPGISTMRMTDGRIDGRRINLRADHPGVVRAVLPHELTHVVLADLFPHKQIPRWADEGMAVLSEPAPEQNVRAVDLNEPLNAGQLFRLNDLVAMDYPDPRYLSLFYAQSVSLTRFLVEEGNPEKFIKFVQQSQWSGVEPALKQVYQINDFGALQSKWLTFAKAHSTATLTATSNRDTSVVPARR